MNAAQQLHFASKRTTPWSRTLVLALFTFVLCGISNRVRADDKSDLGAYYEYCKTTMRVQTRKIVTHFQKRLTILNAKGDEHAEFAGYDGRFTKLKDVELKVFDAEGQLIYKRDKGDLLKVCGYAGYSLYSDICHYLGELKAPNYPYTVELNYTEESNTLFVWRGETLQTDIPVDHAEIILEIDNDIPFRWKIYGSELQPTVSSDSKSTIYRWEMKNLEALSSIDYLPSGTNEPIRLAFAADKLQLEDFRHEGADWLGIGQFYNNLVRDRYSDNSLNPSNPVALDDQHDSVKTIYEEVIGNNRYVAIQIGIGGWQPYSADLTQSRGYGDCKDLSTLLISRLREKGIEAYPCLLNTRGARITDPEFPGFTFNHLITAAIIGSDTIWMDPTCEMCPLYDLPIGDETARVLLITDDGGMIRKLPASQPEDNYEIRNSLIKIGRDLSVTFSTEISLGGEKARRLRYSLPGKERDEIVIDLRERFAGSLRKFAIESYAVENLEDFNEPLILRLEGTCSKPADMIGNQLYCSPMFLDQPSGYETVKTDDRTYPVNFFYPQLIEHHITLEWSPDLKVDSVLLPLEQSRTTSFGEVTLNCVVDSNGVTINMNKRYSAYEVTPDQFDEYESLKDVLKEIARQYVSLELSTN